MKKQILILTFLIAAVFAGMNSYGQVLNLMMLFLTAASNLSYTNNHLPGCTADELHPVQGQVYTYTVTTTAATDDVRWFVVNNKDWLLQLIV